MKCLLDMSAAALAAALFAASGFAAAQNLAPLITPYTSESDMASVLQLFNSQPIANAPYGSLGYLHDGLDIAPKTDLKPFRAACSGQIRWVLTFDESVNVMLDCDSTYSLEYNFEPQVTGSGRAQLANIAVVKGQTVTQGDLIGRLNRANALAHVHFALYKNWVATCPSPYFEASARTSVGNLIHVAFAGADMCQGGNVTAVPLLTPYTNEADMASISAAFNADASTAPWGATNDGIDIVPSGNLKPFRAACAGVVSSVQLTQNSSTANWQVSVELDCNPYVANSDGYFFGLTLNYLFEPMSALASAGQTQLDNIAVSAGRSVAQGDAIGSLYASSATAHLHFTAVPFGTLAAQGVPSLPACPETHFSTQARTSMLKLLHAAWPGASMCYALGQRAAAIIDLVAGWNLAGNGSEAQLAVATAFADPAKVISVWKWLPVPAKWAYYAPSLGDGGVAYAASRGYEALTSIDAGEGFWLNAKTAFSTVLPSVVAVASSSFRPAAASGGTHALRSGWNLIASGDNPTPTQFDTALAGATATPPSPGRVYENLDTLWTWNAAQQRWYFWAPSLVNSGALAAYIASKNYLDFASLPASPAGTLAPTTGFWVHSP